MSLLGKMKPAALALCLGTALSAPAPAAETASAPRTVAGHPDFSGAWARANMRDGFGTTSQSLPFLPEVRAQFERDLAAYRAGKAYAGNREHCLPEGPVHMLYLPYLVKFIHTPDKLIMLAEMNSQMRHVYLNQRHPADLKPSWGAHSVGRWEGDTLVVDTIGFNDKTPLMVAGTGVAQGRMDVPHSTALHVVERFSLSPDGKELRTEVTIEDPKVYAQPWTYVITWAQNNERRMLEFVCADAPLDTNG